MGVWVNVSLLLLVFVTYNSDFSSSGTVEAVVRAPIRARAPGKSLSTPILERFRRSISHEGHNHGGRARSVTGRARTCAERSASSTRPVRRCAARTGTGPARPIRPLSQRCPQRSSSNTGRTSHHSWCNRTCFTECWGAWSDWSDCSAPCGNAGFQEASRSVSPTAQCEAWTIKYGCPGPSSKSQACNRLCHNGGTAQTAHCECPNGFSGTCCEERVTCGDPGELENGVVSPTGAEHNYGTTATYTCNSGYQLTGGEATRMCRQSGNWDGQIPRCTEISCGEPDPIEHGGRTVSGITHPTGRVTYTCIAGHYMQGDEELTCGVTGDWSSPAPTCHPCARNTYKAGSNAAKSCELCPANSQTASTSSHARELCICTQGFSGPNGGPCTAITCPPLSAPTNGVLGDCGNTYPNECEMSCDEGYIRASGDAERRCELNAQWSGHQLVCTACPVNTYKSSPRTCHNCPPDTHTDGAGHGATGCTCDSGFTGPAGGPCNDVDECATAQGGCEQACVNEPGTFRCECPNPGFIVNDDLPLTCIARNQCPVLEAVANGGHVCVMQTGTNTERCEVKCNAGYEHVLPPNAYEQCGPTTDWTWSSDLREVPLLPCQKAFFEGVILEAEVFYFVDQCSEMTEDEIEAVKEEFLNYLLIQQICTQTGTRACTFDDVTIECGEVGEGARRRRRQTRQQIKFTFKIVVDAKEADEVDCNSLCDRPDASERYCQQTCAENYQQNITQTISETVEETLAVTLQRPGEDAGESVSGDFTLGSLTLTPAGRAGVTSTETACGIGMASQDGVCVPCPPGTKLEDNECQLCSIFSYQPESRQTSCRTCLWAAVPGLSRCRNPLEIIEDVIETVIEGDDDSEEVEVEVEVEGRGDI